MAPIEEPPGAVDATRMNAALARLAERSGIPPATVRVATCHEDSACVVEIRNSWLTYTHLIPSGVLSAARHLTLPEPMMWIARARIAPRNEIDALLRRTFGITLDAVYRAPAQPHYTNGKGLAWLPDTRRLILRARGVTDGAANLCWTAAIDLENASVLYQAPIACRIR